MSPASQNMVIYIRQDRASRALSVSFTRRTTGVASLARSALSGRLTVETTIVRDANNRMPP